MRIVLCGIYFVLSFVAYAQQKPVLVRSILYLHTNENKFRSGDSVIVEVSAKNKLLSHTKIGLNKDKINNKLDYQVEFIIDAKGVEKQECLGYTVNILKTTTKPMIWKFNARVEFYFSDSYVIAADQANLKIDQENKSIQFNSF